MDRVGPALSACGIRTQPLGIIMIARTPAFCLVRARVSIGRVIIYVADSGQSGTPESEHVFSKADGDPDPTPPFLGSRRVSE